jgi:glycosyltransferase involved in cell wall biosynthesis
MNIEHSRFLHVLQIPVIPLISPCYRPLRQLIALKETGADVALACLSLADKDSEEKLKTGLFADISIFPVLPNFRQGVRRELGILLFSMKKLARVIDTFKPDIVHVHNPPDTMAFITALVCRSRNIPLVYDIHDSSQEVIEASDFPWVLKMVYKKVALYFEKETVKQSSGIVAISESMKQQMIATREIFRKQSPVFIVMRSVDKTLHELIERAIVEEQDYIYYSGVLYARFIGLESFISATEELLRSGRSKLIIAGDGPYRKVLEEKVKMLGLADAVSFLGHIPKEENLEMIQKACLTIIPYEANPLTNIALPNKIFEYMALGKPVVYPDLPGFREVLGNDNKGRYRPDDKKDMERVVIDLLSDEELRKSLGRKNRELIKSITFEKEFSKLLELYKRILGKT